jgi:hypothetical protein
MKRLLPVFAIALVSLTLAGAASANTRTPRVNHRQHRQHVRIHDGVRSGELTRREARALRRGQLHIRRLEMRAKADGVVTRAERARIARAQNRQSHFIWRLKHNRRDR